MAGSRRRTVAPRFPYPDGSQLKAAHLALLGDYVAVLNYVTPRAAFSPADTPPVFGTFFRAAIRLLVHQHVRKHLQAMADAYLQISTALDADVAADSREWLTETAASCTRMRDSLFTIRRPSVLNVIPTLVGAVPVLIAFAGWYGSRVSDAVDELPISRTAYAAIVIGYVIFFGGLIGAAFFTAFRWKRILLAPNPTNHVARNVYAREYELFLILSRAKRPEAPLDVYLTGAFVFVLLFALIAAGSWVPLPSVLAYLLFALGLVVSGAAGYLTVGALARRRASGLQ